MSIKSGHGQPFCSEGSSRRAERPDTDVDSFQAPCLDTGSETAEKASSLATRAICGRPSCSDMMYNVNGPGRRGGSCDIREAWRFLLCSSLCSLNETSVGVVFSELCARVESRESGDIDLIEAHEAVLESGGVGGRRRAEDSWDQPFREGSNASELDDAWTLSMTATVCSASLTSSHAPGNKFAESKTLRISMPDARHHSTRRQTLSMASPRLYSPFPSLSLVLNSTARWFGNFRR